MRIKGIAKVSLGWFLGCDLSLECSRERIVLDGDDDVLDVFSFGAKVLVLVVQYGVSKYWIGGYGVSIFMDTAYPCLQFLVSHVLVVKPNRKELESVPPTVSKIIESSFI
nr:hypothetical protein [Tanacetum cinerariifolium]